MSTANAQLTGGLGALPRYLPNERRWSHLGEDQNSELGWAVRLRQRADRLRSSSFREQDCSRTNLQRGAILGESQDSSNALIF